MFASIVQSAKKQFPAGCSCKIERVDDTENGYIIAKQCGYCLSVEAQYDEYLYELKRDGYQPDKDF